MRLFFRISSVSIIMQAALLIVVTIALASRAFCTSHSFSSEAHHVHHLHDNIDDPAPDESHAHTHRHGPGKPEHTHEHSHHGSSAAGGIELKSLVSQRIFLVPPPLVQMAKIGENCSLILQDFSGAIFRPPIA